MLETQVSDVASALKAFGETYDQPLRAGKAEVLDESPKVNLNSLKVQRQAIYKILSGQVLTQFEPTALSLIGTERNTLLHIATQVGNIKTATSLIQHGSPVFIKNTDGHSFLDLLMQHIDGLAKMTLTVEQTLDTTLKKILDQISELKMKLDRYIRYTTELASSCREMLKK